MFKKFEGKGDRHSNQKFVRITSAGVYISAEAYRHMGKPDRIAFYYDRPEMALKLKHDPKGIEVNRGTLMCLCQLRKVMPQGRYYYDSHFEKEAIPGSTLNMTVQEFIYKQGGGVRT